MANLWRKFDNFLKSLDAVNDEEMKRLFKHFYWHLYKLAGYVADFTPVSNLFVTILLYSVILSTFIWHEILFVISLPLLVKESHIIIRIIHFMLFVSFSLAVFIWFVWQRPRLMRFHRACIRGFHSYGEEGNKIMVKLEKDFRQSYIISLSILPIVICSCSALMFVTPAIDEATGSPPLPDPGNGIDIDLPIPLWFPWDVKRWHLFQMAHQLVLAGCVGVIISMSDLIFVNVVYTICIQLELLHISIANLEKRSIKKYREIYPNRQLPKSLFDDQKFLRCYESCLKMNIEHHQTIHEVFLDVSPLANLPIFFAFGMEAIVLGMSALDLVTGGERIGDLILNIMLCLAEVSNMAILCWYGQRLIDLSGQVHQSIYSIKWYLCPRNVIDTVQIVQSRSLKSFTIMGIIWPCDLASFQAVMNSAYSYFNLLMVFRGGGE